MLIYVFQQIKRFMYNERFEIRRRVLVDKYILLLISVLLLEIVDKYFLFVEPTVLEIISAVLIFHILLYYL